MGGPDLPQEVRDLVSRQLRSMEEIEVLLLLAERKEPLTVDEIRRHLRLPASELPVTSLARLTAAHLIKGDTAGGEETFSYAVRDARTQQAVDLLRIAYNERPVTLVRLVYEKPTQAQSFADAFRLIKPPE